jgi:hypothetical protein
MTQTTNTIKASSLTTLALTGGISKRNMLTPQKRLNLIQLLHILFINQWLILGLKITHVT